MIRMTFQSGLKENYPGRDTLDQDIVLGWAAIRPTETTNGFATRISAVRQFGKYLAMTGEDAYIYMFPL